MYDAFLRSNPSQLAVRHQISPRLSPVRNQGLKGSAFDSSSQFIDCCADNLVAPANRESLGWRTMSLGSFGISGAIDKPYRAPSTPSQSPRCSRRKSNHQRHSWHPNRFCQGTSGLISPSNASRRQCLHTGNLTSLDVKLVMVTIAPKLRFSIFMGSSGNNGKTERVRQVIVA